MTSATLSIKECITQLCRLLKHSPNPIHINPDTFRQAKHNKPEAVSEMLKLISSLLAADKTNPQTPTDMNVALFESLEKNGYPRVNTLKANLSSLELLLCFGWLLHTTKPLACIYQASLEPTDVFSILVCEKHKVQLLTPFQSKEHLSGDDWESMLSGVVGMKLEHDGFDALSVADQINYVSWMVGKVEMKIDALTSLYLYSTKIDAQIKKQTHSASAGGKRAIESLTADEALLLKHSKLLQLCERDLEKKIQIIQVYNKWKELEPKFWQWLHSAVTEELQEEYLPQLNSSDIPILDDLTEETEITAASMEKVKSLFYDKQREWLDLAKTDSGHLTKVRVEQEHEINKEVQVLLQYVNYLENSFKFAPFTDVKGKEASAHSVTMTISQEIERIRSRALRVAEQLREMEQLCGEELTIILNSKLEGNAILVQASAVT